MPSRARVDDGTVIGLVDVDLTHLPQHLLRLGCERAHQFALGPITASHVAERGACSRLARHGIRQPLFLGRRSLGQLSPCDGQLDLCAHGFSLGRVELALCPPQLGSTALRDELPPVAVPQHILAHARGWMKDGGAQRVLGAHACVAQLGELLEPCLEHARPPQRASRAAARSLGRTLARCLVR